jgi:hypothetical protein
MQVGPDGLHTNVNVSTTVHVFPAEPPKPLALLHTPVDNGYWYAGVPCREHLLALVCGVTPWRKYHPDKASSLGGRGGVAGRRAGGWERASKRACAGRSTGGSTVSGRD